MFSDFERFRFYIIIIIIIRKLSIALFPAERAQRAC